MRRIIDIQKKHADRDLLNQAPFPFHMPETVETKQRIARGVWIIALCATLICVYAIWSHFAHATVLLSPHVREAMISETIVANKSKTTDLSFDTITLSSSVDMTIPSTTQSEKISYATGNIILFNSGSSSVRIPRGTIVKNDNHEYKTTTTVTISKQVKTVPGSVVVQIKAVDPGQEQNITTADFTVPSMGARVYGRTKEPIAGGYKGTLYAADETVMADAIAKMHEDLKNKLFAQALVQIPDTVILYPDLTILSYDAPISNTTTSDIHLTISGSLHGFLLYKKELTSVLTHIIDPDYDDSVPVSIPDLGLLRPKLATVSDVPVKNIETVPIVFSEDVQVLSVIDPLPIQNDLLRAKKKEFTAIMNRYPEIDTATFKISPFWKYRFPETVEDIDIRLAPLD